MWRVLSLLLLCACNTPAPPGHARPFQVITVEGSRFRVYHDAWSAVAIRTNVDLDTSAEKIFPRAAQAMERGSGCRVLHHTLQGDPAVVRADIIC